MLVLEKSARRSDPPHGQESTFDDEQNSLRGDSVSSDEPHDYEAVIGDLIKNASAADTPERLSQILQDGRRKTKRFIEAAEATHAELIHILRPAISAHGQEGEDILNRTFAPQAPDCTHRRPVLPYGFWYRETDGAIEYRKSIKAKTAPKTEESSNTPSVDVEEQWDWLCSPLEIVAHSRNIDGVKWGLLVRVLDPDKVWHEIIVGRDAIATQDEFLRELCAHGLVVSSARDAKTQMRRLLTLATPERRARVTHRTGWHGDELFMLGSEAIGDQSAERLIFSKPSDAANPYQLSDGDLAEWQEEIASLADGNPRLAFSISAAFAGPLLQLLDMEGGGFHWRSKSSDGKTVLLRSAGSVWGKYPGHKGFLRPWRGTANGLEGTALQHNHTLLALDEIGEVDAKEAGQIAYMLSNGFEKIRGHRQGGARSSEAWLLAFLSSGEISLAQKMAEAGGLTKAGQDIRLLDLPADAGKGHGVFEELHGFRSGKELAERLERASNRLYGHAGRAFVREVACDPERASRVASQYIETFYFRNSHPGASHQVGRAARRFALVGAAGEIARLCGVVPWPKGLATGAAAEMFKAWIEARGGVDSGENITALAFIRQLIEKGGNTRFVLWSASTGQSQDVLGVKGAPKTEQEGLFFIIPTALKSECARNGIDLSNLLAALGGVGAIERRENHPSWTQLQRVPHFEHCRSWYVINAAKISEMEAASE